MIDKGYIVTTMTTNTAAVAANSCGVAASSHESNILVAQPGRALAWDYDSEKDKKESLGRDTRHFSVFSSPRPLPYQGNALPG